jgi:hypothetical protein
VHGTKTVIRLLIRSTGDLRPQKRELNLNAFTHSFYSDTILDALNGDPDAAFRLALHYGFGLDDIHENFKWLTIGAENGHLESTYGLTVLVNNKNEYRIHIRGIFWLYQLARRGYRETEARLIKLGYSVLTQNHIAKSYLQLFYPLPLNSLKNQSSFYMARSLFVFYLLLKMLLAAYPKTNIALLAFAQ